MNPPRAGNILKPVETVMPTCREVPYPNLDDQDLRIAPDRPAGSARQGEGQLDA